MNTKSTITKKQVIEHQGANITTQYSTVNDVENDLTPSYQTRLNPTTGIILIQELINNQYENIEQLKAESIRPQALGEIQIKAANYIISHSENKQMDVDNVALDLSGLDDNELSK